jgi:hypothetical protein
MVSKLKYKIQELLSKYKWFNKYKFSSIYKNDGFNHTKESPSKSGPGSDLIQTEQIRRHLPNILKDYQVNSILDIPCGDFYWMNNIDLSGVTYTGGDIVSSIIVNNNSKFSNNSIKFKEVDIINDKLETVDLILIRDLFVHLKLNQIDKAIKNIKSSKSKYLLVTSFTERAENRDIKITGQWRPLNMQLPPFNFKEPLETINEKCKEGNGRFLDKSLLLYKINEL